MAPANTAQNNEIKFEICTCAGPEIHGYITKDGKRFPSQVVSVTNGNYLVDRLAEELPDQFTTEVVQKLKAEILDTGLPVEFTHQGVVVEDEIRELVNEEIIASKNPMASLMASITGMLPSEAVRQIEENQ
jgi:hypothetical protein